MNYERETEEYMNQIKAQAEEDIKEKAAETQETAEKIDGAIAEEELGASIKAILEEETEKADELDSMAADREPNMSPLDFSVPKNVKRCTDEYILSALIITTRNLKDYHFSDLVDDIMFLNSNTKILLAPEDSYDAFRSIYIDCDLKDLVLPEPFYFDEYGNITNKGNEKGFVLKCEVRTIKELSLNEEIEERRYSKLDLIDAIKKLNKSVTFEYDDENEILYIDIAEEKLKLPENFYFKRGKGITNKNNTLSGMYIVLACDHISKKEERERIAKEKAEAAAKQCTKEYTAEELIKELEELNPDYSFVYDNSKDLIYSDIEPEHMKMPQGFYYNEKNGITNKHNTGGNLYLSFRWEPIEKFYKTYGRPSKADLNKKGQKHNTDKTLIFKMVSKKVVELWKQAINKVKTWWDNCKWRKKKIDDKTNAIAEERAKLDAKIAAALAHADNTEDEIVEEIKTEIDSDKIIEESLNEEVAPQEFVNNDELFSTKTEVDREGILIKIAKELEELNNMFFEEQAKGKDADFELLEQLNKKIIELNAEGEKERNKLFGQPEENTPVEPVVEEQSLVEEPVVEEKTDITEEPKEETKENEPEKQPLLQDLKKEKLNKYVGFSANALENVYNSLEAIQIDNKLVVREKEGKFIINDKNLLLKFQMACIWNLVNSKINRDPFCKDAKFEFNLMLVNAVNSLSASDYMDSELILNSIVDILPDDRMRAVNSVLTLKNCWEIMDRYTKCARSCPVAEIDKCMIVDDSLFLDSTKVQKTNDSSFGQATSEDIKLAQKIEQEALIAHIMDERNKTTEEYLEGKMSSERFTELMTEYSQKIMDIKSTKNPQK